MAEGARIQAAVRASGGRDCQEEARGGRRGGRERVAGAASGQGQDAGGRAPDPRGAPSPPWMGSGTGPRPAARVPDIDARHRAAPAAARARMEVVRYALGR